MPVKEGGWCGRGPGLFFPFFFPTEFLPTLAVRIRGLARAPPPPCTCITDAGGVTCCPSRVSTMSGRFAARFHITPGYVGTVGFDPGRKTVTSLLQGVGYQVSHFGKVRVRSCVANSGIPSASLEPQPQPHGHGAGLDNSAAVVFHFPSFPFFSRRTRLSGTREAPEDSRFQT